MDGPALNRTGGGRINGATIPPLRGLFYAVSCASPPACVLRGP
jgi:hypothetical protein